MKPITYKMDSSNKLLVKDLRYLVLAGGDIIGNAYPRYRYIM